MYFSNFFERGITSYHNLPFLLGTIAVCCFTVSTYCYFKKCKNKNKMKHVLHHAKIFVLSEDTPKLNVLFETLLSHANEYPILGFDCEWVNEGKGRKPVALLQIATYNELCLLVRLNTFLEIPPLLKEILADQTIIKVGVAPVQDAKYLYQDYKVEVAGCFDLRHLTNEGHGLATLAKKYLNFQMNKNWRLRCSNWEVEQLTEQQIAYAALDALIAMELFKKMTQNVKKDSIYEYLDIPFSSVRPVAMRQKRSVPVKTKSKEYKIVTRKTPLYSNCYMQAPDGELLCTCDRRKAEWYIQKNLACKIEDDPFTIRLLFEPAGRAVGEVGKYYTTAKLNCCVVCGRPDSYIRKNVIPREYRKLFPVIMKEHTSHDVLLLCVPCHQKSNIADNVLRERLAKLCNAPIGIERDVKQYNSPAARELKSAARALLRDSNLIPEKRKQELCETVLKYFPGETEVTDVILEAAQSIATSVENEEYEPHGKKVVAYFINNANHDSSKPGSGGLVELERMWREHFINTMHPGFLPELWSVMHNKHRLEIRAEEGRIDSEDLKIAGCDENLLYKINS